MGSNPRSAVLLALALAMGAWSVSAQPCIDYSAAMRIVAPAAWPPAGYDVADVASHESYLAVLYQAYPGARLTFYDASDPDALVELSSFEVSPEWCGDCVYDRVLFFGEHLYLFYHEDYFGTGGFDIYDCDPHGGLERIGNQDIGQTVDLWVEGNRLYTLRPWGEQGYPPCHLHIFDVSEPAAPVLLGLHSLPEIYGSAQGLQARGMTVFIAAVGGGLIALDASDPAQLVELGRLSDPADLQAVTLAPEGGVAYASSLSWLDAGLVVVDVSDPSAMRVLSSERQPQSRYLYAQGDRLFVTRSGNDWHGIFVYDIADPASPALLGKIGNIDSTPRLYLAGDVAYVMGLLDPLWVLGPLNGAPAPYRSQLPILDGASQSVSACGDVVFIDSYWAGATSIVDAGDPDAPQVIGELPYLCGDMAFAGDVAYALTSGSLLRVLDIGDPAAPVVLGSLPIGAGNAALALSGRYLYVVGEGLKIIDVDDPAHPVLVGSLAGASCTGVTVHGEHAYISIEYQNGGLQVVDVHDPAIPAVVNHLPLGSARAVSLDWPYIYVGLLNQAYEHLVVLDASVPVAPQQVAALSLPGGFWLTGMALQGDRLYASNRGGVVIVDVEEPSAPALAGTLAIPDLITAGDGNMTLDIAVGTNALFLAERDGGLGVAWLDCGSITPARDAAPPAGMRLAVHPNPFNPKLAIVFTLAKETALRVEAFDVAGRRVAGIAEGVYPAGRHQLEWSAADGKGRSLPSGVYLLRLSADGGAAITARTVLVQ